jgi:hypothetical protein
MNDNDDDEDLGLDVRVSVNVMLECDIVENEGGFFLFKFNLALSSHFDLCFWLFK